MPNISSILCRFGHHVRSRGQARRIEGGWRSRCRRCGKTMLKCGDGDWTIETSGQDRAIDSAAPPHSEETSVDGLVAPPRKRRRLLIFRRRNRVAPAAE